jgi:hypothetical protein
MRSKWWLRLAAAAGITQTCLAAERGASGHSRGLTPAMIAACSLGEPSGILVSIACSRPESVDS